MNELIQSFKTANTAMLDEMKQAMPPLILFFDTETTGLPEYSKPSEDPCQPHLVEIAAQLYTHDAILIGQYQAIIKPNGWVIPDDIIAIHGITNEQAAAEGMDEAVAYSVVSAMHQMAGLRVAHNRNFDDRIMRIGFKRYTEGDTLADEFKAAPAACTAMLSKPLCKLPPTEKMKATNFKNSFKTPTLAEAYLHFTGEELPNAHRAMADVKACARVYFAIHGETIQIPDVTIDFTNIVQQLTEDDEAAEEDELPF